MLKTSRWALPLAMLTALFVAGCADAPVDSTDTTADAPADNTDAENTVAATECPDCKEGAPCAHCAANKQSECPDCKDGVMCAACEAAHGDKAAACADCKDGEKCEACKAAEAASADS